MTQAIDELLNLIDGPAPSLPSSLDEADIADALARATDTGDPARERALAILARFSPGAAGVLAAAVEQILASEPTESAAAINALALSPGVGPDVVPQLLAATTGAADPVAGVVGWRALQQVATGEQFDEVQAGAPPADDMVGAQAQFALSVIACRAGLSGFEPSVPDVSELLALDEGGERPLASIQQSEASVEDLERVEGLTPGELYLVAPAAETLSAVDCGGVPLLLCGDSATQGSWPGALVAAPALPAVVLLSNPESGACAVRQLAITWPDGEGGFHLSLFLPDGSRTHYGHAASADVGESEASVAALSALERPGASALSTGLAIGSGGATLTGQQLTEAEASIPSLEPEAE